MMTRHSEAQWLGDLKRGGGTVRLGSGAYDGPYSFRSRFESARDHPQGDVLGHVLNDDGTGS